VWSGRGRPRLGDLLPFDVQAGHPACDLDLTADEIEALLPEACLDTKPTAAGRAPFSLG
jgi:hypothetical protein